MKEDMQRRQVRQAMSKFARDNAIGLVTTALLTVLIGICTHALRESADTEKRVRVLEQNWPAQNEKLCALEKSMTDLKADLRADILMLGTRIEANANKLDDLKDQTTMRFDDLKTLLLRSGSIGKAKESEEDTKWQTRS